MKGSFFGRSGRPFEVPGGPHRRRLPRPAASGKTASESLLTGRVTDARTQMQRVQCQWLTSKPIRRLRRALTRPGGSIWTPAQKATRRSDLVTSEVDSQRISAPFWRNREAAPTGLYPRFLIAPASSPRRMGGDVRSDVSVHVRRTCRRPSPRVFGDGSSQPTGGGVSGEKTWLPGEDSN